MIIHNSIFTRTVTLVAAVSAVALLAGCGGGGGELCPKVGDGVIRRRFEFA